MLEANKVVLLKEAVAAVLPRQEATPMVHLARRRTSEGGAGQAEGSVDGGGTGGGVSGAISGGVAGGSGVGGEVGVGSGSVSAAIGDGVSGGSGSVEEALVALEKVEAEKQRTCTRRYLDTCPHSEDLLQP
jgi:hypothetical protein